MADGFMLVLRESNDQKMTPYILFIEFTAFMCNWTELKTANCVYWVQHVFSSLSWCYLILRKQIHKYMWVLRKSFLNTGAVYRKSHRRTKPESQMEG